ncbi:MAG: acetyltransferase [Calothrix sp. SM1_7_51]|nr:acetyltransferase [Calothrix sp. SM1_7_51]
MFLQDQQTDSLIKVLDVEELINPNQETIYGKSQSGEEEQDEESFAKENLIFPSGEALPRCWIDANYKGAVDKSS